MNTVWFLLLFISVLVSLINGRLEELTKSLFEGAKAAVEISLYLLGIISLWLGITKIIEESGLIYRLAHAFQPLICALFRKIPAHHPAITSITLNFLANFFGLGNAATPLGIKAMQDLQTLNNDKETLTFEMMLFIVINTASIQLIPFSVIGILADFGSANASLIVGPTILSTFISAILAVGSLFLFRKILK
ncbi:MAG: nucleoside recognition domain-containing protein [bacterium]